MAEAEARAERAAIITVPVYGSVIERVIELTNSNHRALNLASGNYVTAGPDHLLDFGPEGTNTLRAAGVDWIDLCRDSFS